MNLRKRIWKIISDACVYFTVAEFFVLFVATGFSELDPEAGGGVGKYLSLGAAALLFLGCFLLSLLNLTFKLDLSSSLRVLIHFIGTTVAYSLVFIVIPGVYNDFGAIFVRLGVFVIIYAVGLLIGVIVTSSKRNHRADSIEYESQFGEFFDKKNRNG